MSEENETSPNASTAPSPFANAANHSRSDTPPAAPLLNDLKSAQDDIKKHVTEVAKKVIDAIRKESEKLDKSQSSLPTAAQVAAALVKTEEWAKQTQSVANLPSQFGQKLEQSPTWKSLAEQAKARADEQAQATLWWKFKPKEYLLGGGLLLLALLSFTSLWLAAGSHSQTTQLRAQLQDPVATLAQVQAALPEGTGKLPTTDQLAQLRNQSETTSANIDTLVKKSQEKKQEAEPVEVTQFSPAALEKLSAFLLEKAPKVDPAVEQEIATAKKELDDRQKKIDELTQSKTQVATEKAHAEDDNRKLRQQADVAKETIAQLQKQLNHKELPPGPPPAQRLLLIVGQSAQMNIPGLFGEEIKTVLGKEGLWRAQPDSRIDLYTLEGGQVKLVRWFTANKPADVSFRFNRASSESVQDAGKLDLNTLQSEAEDQVQKGTKVRCVLVLSGKDTPPAKESWSGVPVDVALVWPADAPANKATATQQKWLETINQLGLVAWLPLKGNEPNEPEKRVFTQQLQRLLLSAK